MEYGRDAPVALMRDPACALESAFIVGRMVYMTAWRRCTVVAYLD